MTSFIPRSDLCRRFVHIFHVVCVAAAVSLFAAGCNSQEASGSVTAPALLESGEESSCSDQEGSASDLETKGGVGNTLAGTINAVCNRAQDAACEIAKGLAWEETPFCESGCCEFSIAESCTYGNWGHTSGDNWSPQEDWNNACLMDGYTQENCDNYYQSGYEYWVYCSVTATATVSRTCAGCVEEE